MIKKAKDILDVLNVCGKNIKHLVYDSTNTPIVGNEKTFTITWAGDGLWIGYTIYFRQHFLPWGLRTGYSRKKLYYSGGGTEVINATYRTSPGNTNLINDDKLYIKCTNVTSLIVNGEQLI